MSLPRNIFYKATQKVTGLTSMTTACLLAVYAFFVPYIVFAAGGIQFQLKDYTGMANPNGAEQFLLAILNIAIVIATPIIVLFIIYAGFLYVTAQGNAQQVQQATRALTYAIIGAVLILGAVAIAGIIQSTVGAFRA